VSYEQTKSGLLMPISFASRPEMREVATTRDGRDITRGYVDPFMLQQPDDSVLQLRGGGDYKIYQEVLRDDQVGATFAQRRLAVVGCEWQVDAGGDSRADKKAADHLREQLDNIGFDRITDRMLYGVYYGHAAAEVMWGRDGSHITIDEIKVRNRRRFGFDGFGNLRLKTFAKPDGELLPERKFWHYCTGADNDDEPYGLGLAHWLYWPVFFKRAGIKYWMIFLERFGQPTVLGKHPVNALQPERQKLLDALEAISTDTGVTIPQGMEISFLEAARSGTADYTTLCEHMDNAIAKLVLGQTASTQGTPGKLGNDKLQGDVRDDLIRADADLVCESFNRSVVEWLTAYNYPNAKPPRVYRVTDPEADKAAQAERDKKIYDMGFKPTLKYIQEQYGGEWQERQEKSPAVADAQFADKSKTLTDQLDDSLQSVTDDWIKSIEQLVMEADSLDAIRDGLDALQPNMSLERYADLMAEALRLAVAKGRADIMDEISNGN
jgi:phage gp29-like protein